MYFVLTVGIAMGTYFGFHFREELEGILDTYNFFHKKSDLKNTVLPQCLSQYIPRVCLDVLESAKFILDLLLLRIEQDWLRTCTPVSPNLFCLRFTISHRHYALLVRPVRGPLLKTFKTPANEDVSETIEPYLLGARALVTSITPEMLHLGRVVDEEGTSFEPQDPLIVLPTD